MSARCRPGIALVAALTLLTLSGIVIAALVATSVTAQRSIRLGGSGAAALAAADYAVSTVLGDAAAYQLATLPLGATRHFDVLATETSALHVDVAAARLPRGVLWLVADAAIAGIDSGERRVNVVARFPEIAPLPVAAVESRGDVSIATGVTLGTDTTGDADCAAPSSAPVIATAPGAVVTAPPGVRAEVRAPAADSNSYLLTASQRSALATATGVTRVAGDTTISGGSIEGILLVDGALTITGPLIVTGLVVATGPIRITAGGALTATGAVLSAHAGPGPAFDLRAATIRFNSCVIAAVFRVAAHPRRVPARAWVELY